MANVCLLVRPGSIEDRVQSYFSRGAEGTCFDAADSLPDLKLTSVENACRSLRRKGVLTVVEKASKKSHPIYRMDLI